MFHAQPITAASKADVYNELARQVQALVEGESNMIANASNFAAQVFHCLPDLNWAGFYFYDGAELVVGPFQGLPACIRIPLGKGVCGIAASSLKTQLVADVNAHANHITCDAASRSEIVVPLRRMDGSLLGVWDVDSPLPNRFDDVDRVGMEKLCRIFMVACEL